MNHPAPALTLSLCLAACEADNSQLDLGSVVEAPCPEKEALSQCVDQLREALGASGASYSLGPISCAEGGVKADLLMPNGNDYAYLSLDDSSACTYAYYDLVGSDATLFVMEREAYQKP